MPATHWRCIYGGLTLDVDRHYIGSVTAITHQEKGIITLESNPSRGTVLLMSRIIAMLNIWNIVLNNPRVIIIFRFTLCLLWMDTTISTLPSRGRVATSHMTIMWHVTSYTAVMLWEVKKWKINRIFALHIEILRQLGLTSVVVCTPRLMGSILHSHQAECGVKPLPSLLPAILSVDLLN